MPELIAFQGKTECINIPEKIGVKWSMVGILLLDDSDGSIVEAIEREYRDNAFEINRKILARWITGQGTVECTWQGLIGVLRTVNREALAESIEEALTTDKATDSEPGKCSSSHLTDKPVPLPRSSTARKPQRPMPKKRQNLHPPAAEKPKDLATPHTQPSPQQPAKAAEASAATSTAQCEPSPPPIERQREPSAASSADPPKQPPPPPTLTPLSAEWHFVEYLKRFYQSCPLPVLNKWPPSPSKRVINLAAITREKVEVEEQHQFMLATLHGDVDQILEKKAPVNIESLLDTQPGKKQQCVLVEGAPGVGKTTLVWEVCKRWGEGKLFQQYSLVMLLRLRDAAVQRAQTIKDFVCYMYDVQKRQEDIAQYIEDSYGKDTLVILEGLDEFQRDLLTQPSIFNRLLAGTKLPDATILITSRPSATEQLWQNWMERISRHIEILGFTEKNIDAYIASILAPEQIPALNTYLSTAVTIKQLMYIPLHSAVVIHIYRMCTHSQKSLPTNKTALYKLLVQTILNRYLASHHKYQDDKIEVEHFTDLPSDVRPAFMELLELAYVSVTEQQLIFRDRDTEIKHLGFMDVVTELYDLSRRARYSYNFLHLSIQEFLGASYVSLMDIGKQEGLLNSMCSQMHLHNMALFLAGLTKFRGLNRSIVKRAIHGTCKWRKLQGKEEITLSDYALQMVYETEDVSLLDGYDYYRYNLSDYSLPFIFTAVGYCIVQSNFKWRLRLGNHANKRGDTSQYMHSTEGVQLLTQAINTQQTPRYSIDSLAYYHLQPLAEHSLPSLVPTMNQLRRLELSYASADILLHTLQAITAASITTLERVYLSYSEFNSQAVRELCTVLVNNCQCMYLMALDNCHISNEGTLCLSQVLSKLAKLAALNLGSNAISDTGAWAVITAVLGLKEVKEVHLWYNSISYEGKVRLRKFKEENKAAWLNI